MGFTTTKARRELERINKRLRGYDVLLSRKRQLEAFLALADELTRKPKARQRIRLESAKLPTGRTSDVAARVLQQHGQVHLKMLYKQMKANGWTGSGNEGNERKAIYVAMLRDPRFVRVGRNIWALGQIQTKAAS